MTLLEEIDVILSNAVLYIVILLVVIVAILFIASKLLREDVQVVQYAIATGGLFAAGFVTFLAINILFNGLVERYAFLSLEDNPFTVRVLMFFSYFVLLIGPPLFLLKDAFMFFRQRLVISTVYALIIALVFVISAV